MNISVLGTGVVGNTIGSRLTELPHKVMMGSRDANNPKAAEWARSAGANASTGTFADAARHGEVIFNCTQGVHSLDALRAAGEEALAEKVLIDLANPLDFSRGFPPSMTVCNTDSLGEQIQKEFPRTRVVKALNTMNCSVMVKPSLVPGDHNVFMAGNDATAKQRVVALLEEFGWKRANVLDLGDITAARGLEMLLPLWLQLFVTGKNPNINFHVVRGQPPAKT